MNFGFFLGSVVATHEQVGKKAPHSGGAILRHEANAGAVRRLLSILLTIAFRVPALR